MNINIEISSLYFSIKCLYWDILTAAENVYVHNDTKLQTVSSSESSILTSDYENTRRYDTVENVTKNIEPLMFTFSRV